eukprot:15441352-Alexandrium_andersonii.AAC.1
MQRERNPPTQRRTPSTRSACTRTFSLLQPLTASPLAAQATRAILFHGKRPDAAHPQHQQR